MSDLWKFISDKYFICIHLKYDQNKLIKTFEPSDQCSLMNKKNSASEFENEAKDFILKSDICLGILPKKGNASVKSMLKCYKQEDYYSQHMNTQEYPDFKI